MLTIKSVRLHASATLSFDATGGSKKKRMTKNEKPTQCCVGFDGFYLTGCWPTSPHPYAARLENRLQLRAEGDPVYSDSGAAFGETATGVVASTLTSLPSADTGTAVPADESSLLLVGVLYDLIARTVRPAMMSEI